MYCSIITQNNRICKNHIYKEGLCYIHRFNPPPKKVKFNESLNTIIEYKPYIQNLRKLDDGRWYYQTGKNPRCSKNIKYNYI